MTSNEKALEAVVAWGEDIGGRIVSVRLDKSTHCNVPLCRHSALSAADAKVAAVDRNLGNLLARIHRDGGHYQEKHGTMKACVDADLIVSELLATQDRAATLTSENKRMREALQEHDAARAAIGGCGDGGCVVVKPVGQHTNGGCRCMRDQIKSQRFAHVANRFAARARAALTAPAPGGERNVSDALEAIAAERRRQIEVEGWTPEHDDRHTDETMPVAAACYALSAVGWKKDALLEIWPKAWGVHWLKPKSPRRDLVRAAALIVAEIERLDRLAAASPRNGGE